MDIEARLTEIEEALRRGHAEKPEKMLTDLMSQMRKETLAEWRPTLEPVIDSFQPKRKRQLQEILDRRIEGRPAEVREPPMTSGYAVAAKAGQPDAGAEFRNDLEELSRKHIFQWGTHYRDRLFGHFDVFLERMEPGYSRSTNPIRAHRTAFGERVFATCCVSSTVPMESGSGAAFAGAERPRLVSASSTRSATPTSYPRPARLDPPTMPYTSLTACARQWCPDRISQRVLWRPPSRSVLGMLPMEGARSS